MLKNFASIFFWILASEIFSLNTAIFFSIFSQCLNWCYWPYRIWHLFPGLLRCRRTRVAGISVRFFGLEDNFVVWVFCLGSLCFLHLWLICHITLYISFAYLVHIYSYRTILYTHFSYTTIIVFPPDKWANSKHSHILF